MPKTIQQETAEYVAALFAEADEFEAAHPAPAGPALSEEELMETWEEQIARHEQAYIDRTEKAQERRFAEWLAFPGDR